jgi:DNA-binding MurR/RpiR family transcriptional regulator
VAIEERYATLSAQQRRAADFLLSHYDDTFALSVHEFGRAARVSEATLVRFARELGYRGYLELRAALMNEAKTGLTRKERFVLAPPSDEPTATVLRVAAQEVANINRTIEAVDQKSFSLVTKRLREAPLCATVGLGVSALMARLVAYELNMIGVPAQVLSRELLSLTEQVALLPKGTVLFVFAFPPYSEETLLAAGRARARRLTVFGITDRTDSPLAAQATAVLVAHTENVLFTNSLSGVVALINAIVTEVALGNKTRALKQLELSAQAYGHSALPEPQL